MCDANKHIKELKNEVIFRKYVKVFDNDHLGNLYNSESGPRTDWSMSGLYSTSGDKENKNWTGVLFSVFIPNSLLTLCQQICKSKNQKPLALAQL